MSGLGCTYGGHSPVAKQPELLFLRNMAFGERHVCSNVLLVYREVIHCPEVGVKRRAVSGVNNMLLSVRDTGSYGVDNNV